MRILIQILSLNIWFCLVSVAKLKNNLKSCCTNPNILLLTDIFERTAVFSVIVLGSLIAFSLCNGEILKNTLKF